MPPTKKELRVKGKKQLADLNRAAAKAAHLTYVRDNLEGIQRHKRGKSYFYTYKGKRIGSDVERVRKLAIPPSWTNVWICPNASGNIQATGIDLNGRKQYRYHAEWNSLRNENKFYRLLAFGKALPKLRRRIARDLKSKELSCSKVIATAIRLMEETHIRIGNNGYEKLYGSYGLTTLKDKHVTISGSKALFRFKGKKGVEHQLQLKNKRLASIIRQCRDIPGKELFQYFDDKGEPRSIDSGQVNAYIKEGTEGEFSAKDFRTWAGSVQALRCLSSVDGREELTDMKKKIAWVVDEVSARLGNTRNICRKYYIHPILFSLYEEGRLTDLLKEVDCHEQPRSRGLSNNEKILLRVLKRA